MKVFAHVGFHGHWPVGTAAVVIASDRAKAAKLLRQELATIGLDQSIAPADFVEIGIGESSATVLNDGNY